MTENHWMAKKLSADTIQSSTFRKEKWITQVSRACFSQPVLYSLTKRQYLWPALPEFTRSGIALSKRPSSLRAGGPFEKRSMPEKASARKHYGGNWSDRNAQFGEINYAHLAISPPFPHFLRCEREIRDHRAGLLSIQSHGYYDRIASRARENCIRMFRDSIKGRLPF